MSVPPDAAGIAATAAPSAPSAPWYQAFYAALDRNDDDLVDRFFTGDVTFRIGNTPAVHGREAFRETMQQFFSMIGGMVHQIDNVVHQDDEWVIEATVSYTRLDGNVVRLPTATVATIRDGLVAAMRVYVDATPVFAEPVDGGAGDRTG